MGETKQIVRNHQIIVVVAGEQADQCLVTDGYERVAALTQLGRDTVEAVVWSLSGTEALLLNL